MQNSLVLLICLAVCIVVACGESPQVVTEEERDRINLYMFICCGLSG